MIAQIPIVAGFTEHQPVPANGCLDREGRDRVRVFLYAGYVVTMLRPSSVPFGKCIEECSGTNQQSHASQNSHKRTVLDSMPRRRVKEDNLAREQPVARTCANASQKGTVLNVMPST